VPAALRFVAPVAEEPRPAVYKTVGAVVLLVLFDLWSRVALRHHRHRIGRTRAGRANTSIAGTR
jgi:hypothetical protein